MNKKAFKKLINSLKTDAWMIETKAVSWSTEYKTDCYNVVKLTKDEIRIELDDTFISVNLGSKKLEVTWLQKMKLKMTLKRILQQRQVIQNKKLEIELEKSL